MYLMDLQLHGCDDDAVRGKGGEIDALRSTQAWEQNGTQSPSCLQSIPCLGAAWAIISLGGWELMNTGENPLAGV